MLRAGCDVARQEVAQVARACILQLMMQEKHRDERNVKVGLWNELSSRGVQQKLHSELMKINQSRNIEEMVICSLQHQDY